VVEDGAAHIRKISVARDFGTEVETRDGLNPPVDLAEGGRVQVRTEAKTD
jgi:hypothetical protein